MRSLPSSGGGGGTYLSDGGTHKGEGWVSFKPLITHPGQYKLKLRASTDVPRASRTANAKAV